MANDMTQPDAAGAFEFTDFFAGRTRAWGIFEDRFGRVHRRFTVDMHGGWREGAFLLDEQFAYDDGRTETRVWRVLPSGGARFSATCADCVGEARGHGGAGAIRIAYRFRLKLPSREITVDFDDRIYRIDARTAVNRATLRKWGVKLGELSLFFERMDR